jgi:hypothetical protein
MRSILTAAAAAMMFVQPAAAAEVRFIGGATITAQTGTCPNGDMRGNAYGVRFRPAAVGDNGNNSHLNLFSGSFAQAHRLNNGSFGNVERQVEASFIGYGSGPSDNAVFVRFTSFRPRTNAGAAQASVDGNTRFIDVIARIRGFDFQPACTVTMAVSLTRVFDD